ncbi:aminoglycoside adenylyltransferase domain-containing protein [Rossellomorea vietnamensis]|uniref:DUF4111 domain-containing protein n=1 Tax=Rossellomorea aquimaris TaxID=189382 RepID=A0A5D4TXY9_9BACI|nr:aminoglycoside adenylyltransferase domain-containing protein [Rossellomorea aquimaris]TYS79878.1 DUF4111 domain-containing protein [Rossellomorea aquimaris]
MTILLHTSIQEVLQEYISLWNNRLPDRLEGLYLHGSIVLNAYVKDRSDIDFAAVTRKRLAEAEIQTLEKIHEEIAGQFETTEMDGMFIVWEDLGRVRPEDNAPFPYYNGGELKWDTEFNPVTWVLLREKGISVLGPDITKLPFDASKELLTTYVRENMNCYWRMRIERLENSLDQEMNPSSKEISEEVEWTVLGLLRQYFTLKESNITSKAGAGEYGLLNLPEIWHPVIHEALNIRRNKYVKLFQSDRERMLETAKFSKYLIYHCNKMVQDK